MGTDTDIDAAFSVFIQSLHVSMQLVVQACHSLDTSGPKYTSPVYLSWNAPSFNLTCTSAMISRSAPLSFGGRILAGNSSSVVVPDGSCRAIEYMCIFSMIL